MKKISTVFAVGIHFVGYHRILQNAVVTSVKIAIGKTVSKICSKPW